MDVQVLSTVPVMFSYWAKPEHTLDLSRFINDDLALTVQKYPKRFVALGTVPLQDADRAIVELERCTRELWFPGIELGNHVGGVNLDDPRFDPIWEAAQDLGAAIFVHPWDMMARDRMERYWLPWLVGMPAESALAMASIAMGGVMDRYPDLRFCFAHGGGSFFATLGRIEHGFNMRPDLCQTHSQTLPTLTAKRFYVDALVHDHEALALLVNKAGVDKIALGTDYPFPLGELQPGRLVESADFLSSAQKKAIFSQTALQFLDLPQGTFG